MSLFAIDAILLNVAAGERRAALMSEGRPVEVIVERASRPSLLGNIYLGRVERVLPGLDAAFVDIGAARSGFLPAGEADVEEPTPIEGCVEEGEAILVQVQKDATGEKGAALTMRLTFPGRWLVFAPGQSGVAVSQRIEDDAERRRLSEIVERFAGSEGGYIVRTSAAGAEAGVLKAEGERLRALWHTIEASQDEYDRPTCLHRDEDSLVRLVREAAGPALTRVVVDDRETFRRVERALKAAMPELAQRLVLHTEATPLFEAHGVEAEIGQALGPHVELEGGGSLRIERTEALVAIDVNMGRSSARGRAEERALETNLEAAREIARQMRLRSLAGRIVIDFIGMERRANQQQVVDELRRAFASDRSFSRIGGYTAMGLVEVSRKRGREPLEDVLCEPCAACEGRHARKTAETVAHELLRAVMPAAAASPGRPLKILAAAEVVASLDGASKSAREAIETQLGRPLTLEADGTRPRESFEIVAE
ncbi:MAG: Rne/Rng family ribonuclease [Alphaproteobacteria bacterium]